MAGVKGKSGRKKDISKVVSEAISRIDDNLPSLFDKLISLAKNGDREALFYCIDRRLGKAKQTQDINIEAKVGLSTEQRAYYIEQMSKMKQEVKQIALQGSEEEITETTGEEIEAPG